MTRQYPKAPVVGVGVVILRDDTVLLVQRAKDPGRLTWSLPGGAQELGETVFDAARREVREETGLDVTILGLVDVVDSIRRDAEGLIEYHYTLVDVAAESLFGEPQASSDAAACQWVRRDRTDEFKLWTKTSEVIAAAFALRDRIRTR